MTPEDMNDNSTNPGASTMNDMQSTMNDMQSDMEDFTDDMADDASAAGNAFMDKASGVTADVTARVKDAAASATDFASKKADVMKDSIADEGHRLAQSLRSAASDRGESVQARVLDVVAGGVEQVSESMRGRSLSSMYSDVQAFARRNPGAFVAGAAIVGFAVARFVRSGSDSAVISSNSWENRS